MGHLVVPCAASGAGDASLTANSVTAGVANRVWRDVAWSSALGLFCAVGTTGTDVMTSPDGRTWTLRSFLPLAAGFRSIAWSSTLGIFCAVNGSAAGAGSIMTSPDGINWTSQTGAGVQVPQCILWASGLGLFVVGGSRGAGAQNIQTSPDGVNWTARNCPNFTDAWRGIGYSDTLSQLVLVKTQEGASPGGQDCVAYSADGVTWFNGSFPNDGNAGRQRVAWSDTLGLFVAMSDQSSVSKQAYSADGVTWTAFDVFINGATRPNFQRIIWSAAHQMFVAVSLASSPANQLCKGLWTSTDGTTWKVNVSNPNSAGDGDWSSVCESPDLDVFSMVANAGTTLAATATVP